MSTRISLHGIEVYHPNKRSVEGYLAPYAICYVSILSATILSFLSKPSLNIEMATEEKLPYKK